MSRPAVTPSRIAGLLVVWAVAWSTPLGQVTWDTKYDLILDPWTFLSRALHVWDPQVTWGGLSNQGYGYLFPMGPFFAVMQEIVPAWVAQRLWWMLLLTVGFVGALGLLRALGIGTETTRTVGAVSWVLAPKVVSSIAVLSAEIQAHILAPLVLWPVVLAWRGSIGPARASLLSGVAILCCGGVNATATLLALVPTGLFLVTRTRWWRASLTWLWLAASLAATSWWLGPLLVLGRYSPPFLDWIETADAVSAPIGLLDIVRGTTHWLGHLLTPGGAWWPAGYQLATSPVLIVLTTSVAALGLIGLAMRSLPHWGFLWLCLVLGVFAMALPHTGPLDSPLVSTAQGALDGPLAPFRNIHKIDVLVRLPMMIGLTHLLTALSRRWVGESMPRALRPAHRMVVGATAVLVVAAASPAFTGAVAPRGGHDEVPQHWAQVGAWLDAQPEDGATLILPAASFGEYRWGRTIDEPLRGLTKSPFIVRDAVPLAPAGAVRVLDEIEYRALTGRSLGATPDLLRSWGVQRIVVRNDLATTESGRAPVELVRSAVRLTPGVVFEKGFGRKVEDLTGTPIHPVEVYRLDGSAAPEIEMWPAAAVVGASGSSDDLLTMSDAAAMDDAVPARRPVVFDGDRTTGLTPGGGVMTDGVRTRERFFGAPRGEDASATLTASEAPGTRDFRPWPDDALLSSVGYSGVDDLTASSSIADSLTFVTLQPGMRHFAAFDGTERTPWLTMWDPEPTIMVTLTEAVDLSRIEVTPANSADLPVSVARATAVRVTTDQGEVEAALDAGSTWLDVPEGSTRSVSLTITDTTVGSPATVLTGLAEITIPGVRPVEELHLAERPASDPARTIVLSAGLPGRDACLVDDVGLRCLAGESVAPEILGTASYRLGEVESGEWLLSGHLRSVGPVPALTGSPDVEVEASSTRSSAVSAQAASVVDGDARTAWSPAFSDTSPSLTFRFPTEARVTGVTLTTRDDWAERVASTVRIEVGGQEITRGLPVDGRIEFPPATGSLLRLTFLADRGSGLGGMELEEVRISGLPLQPAQDALTAPCGDGPPVRVNGAAVPTQASVTRDGWLGLQPIRWEACAPVALNGSSDTLSISSWNGLAPSLTVATQTAANRNAIVVPDEPVDVITNGAGLTARVPVAAEERLLVLTRNANPGWVATLGGDPLVSQTVDARRQGFVVPAGAGGELRVEFAPETTYRALLFGGLSLAGLLLAAAAIIGWVGRRRRSEQPRRLPVHGEQPVPMPGGTWWVVGAAVLLGGLVAGPAGSVAAGLGAAAAHVVPSRLRLVAVGILILGSGWAYAVLAPGSLGPTWLEAVSRIVILFALALAASVRPPRDGARDGELDELVAHEGEEQADREPDGQEGEDAPSEERGTGQSEQRLEDR